MADLEAFKDLPEGNITSHILTLIKEADIEKYEVKVSLGSQHGDNYLGTVFAVDITGETINGNPKNLNLIVKSSPRIPAMRKMVQITKIYSKEIAVYQSYLPEIFKIQNHVIDYDNGELVDGFLPTAKLYGGSSTENDEYLIMNNMKREGFIMVSRLEALPFDNIEFVLRQIGYLHALSVLFKRKNPELYTRLGNELSIDLTAMEPDVLAGWAQMTTAAISKAIDCYDPVEDKEICDRIRKYQETAFAKLEEVNKLTKFADDPYAFFIHGDCWSNNILYKYDKNDKLIATCFLDWQISRIASPACELAYFIYNCCGPEDLKLRFDEMIKIYYNSFSEMLIKHDLLPEEILPFSVLQDHIKEYFHSGLTMAMSTLPMFTSNSEEIPSFENMEKFDEEELKKWQFTSKNHHLYVQRVRGLIAHAISIGIL